MHLKVPQSRWLLPIAVTVHNLEEVVYFPRFWLRHNLHIVSACEFSMIALAIALLAFLITYASQRRQDRGAWHILFLAFCWVMLLNAFWHIGATIYLHSYAPGVVTAVLIVLPVMSYLLLQERPVRQSGSRV